MEIPRPKEDYLVPFTPSLTLDPAHTALGIIDLQYGSACRTTGLGAKMIREGTEHITKWRFDRIEQFVLPNVKRLLTFFRDHNMRVLYVTGGSMLPDFSDKTPHTIETAKATNNRLGTREHEILDEIKPMPGELAINKTTTGAFSSTGIDCLLRTWDIKYLLFTGVSTNVCVWATATDAVDKGYHCVLVEDACGAGKEEYHIAAIINFQGLYGRVSSTEEVLRELKQHL
jgi:nicotinamidase-related amidase